jgi:hypothetical protein
MNLNSLKAGALLVALVAAFPVVAAPAARVDFVVGDVVAKSHSGSQRTVTRGSQLESGDTVLTGNGRAQMRFTDGAMVSLRPGSEFRIDDYHYSGKPDGEERGFFSLLKGGLRTITGWVGRNDRSKYQVKTVVATIGVRGTEYSVTYGNSINVNAGEGVVEVCNAGGCLLLYPGDEGYVATEGSEPVLVQTGEERPKKDDAPPETGDVEAPANDRNADGQTAALDALPAQHLLFAAAEIGGSAAIAGRVSGSGPVDASLGLQSFSSSSGIFSTTGTTSQLGVAPDGSMSWGRWDAASSLGTSILTPSLTTVSDATLFYVEGKPTALATLGDVATLPTALFSSVDGSFITPLGISGPITGASMDVSFSTLTVNNLFITFNVGALNTNYDIQATGMAIATSGGLTFSGSGVVSATGGSTCANCSASSIDGAFFGAGASHAGVAFRFSDPDQSGGTSFSGVTAMQDTGTGG